MKYAMFFLATLLAMPAQASAVQVTKQLKVDWDYPATAEATITGFRLYNQDRQLVFDGVPPNVRSKEVSYTFDDAVPQAFHMTAVAADGEQSQPSNIYVYKPPYRPLIGVGTFTIKIQE